jgi:hypothetical protein
LGGSRATRGNTASGAVRFVQNGDTVKVTGEVKGLKPKGYDKPGESARKPNRDLLMFWHVEGFLLESKANEKHRAGLIRGDDLAACEAFSEWFRFNPFRIVQPDELGKTLVTEAIPITISQAAKAKGVRPKDLLEAHTAGQIQLWRPKGEPWKTTLEDVDRWLAEYPRPKHGGKRNGAGSGGKRDGSGRPRRAA